MQSRRNKIDTPLGQTARPARRKGRRLLPGAPGLLVGLAALAIFAVSAGIALRERPFREPAPAALTSPERADTDTASAGTAHTAAQAGGGSGNVKADRTSADRKTTNRKGPAIIRMGQGSASRDNAVVLREPSAPAPDGHLAYLPDRALIEESEMGPLPVRGADGTRPFDVYAGPWSGARGARIAVVIGGIGLSQTGTLNAIEKLPSGVTLAFAPQGNSLDRWMREARRAGHELLVQVPLEPYDYPHVNPGRNTLTVEASTRENLRDLRWALSRITNYTGIVNYMGARFIADRGPMEGVMHELNRRGLMFLDDGSAARSVAGTLASKEGVPFAAGDVLIDQSRERGTILKKLDELERIARAKGSAVGMGSAFDVTVDAVSAWANEAKKRGIEIVPISALAADPERN